MYVRRLGVWETVKKYKRPFNISSIYIYFKGEMSDSFTNYNYVGNTKVSVSMKKNLCQQMHIKRDISNWNIKVILSVLIGAGNPELLSTICLLSATI